MEYKWQKCPKSKDLSHQLVRSFMTEKLMSNMKFANVPRCTDVSNSSNLTSKRPPLIVLKFCAVRDQIEVLKLTLWARQFHCGITKHLPISMQRQRKSLLAHANILFKAGKKIKWEVIDVDYCLFADGERVKSEVRSISAQYISRQ